MKQFFEQFKNSYVQTFDDTKKERLGFLKTFPMVEIEKNMTWLKEMNKKGMGVFFTPNPCKNGRKEEEVTSIEWVYVDMDEGTKSEMMKKIESSPFFPHIIIESSRSYHLYWKIKCNRSQFDKIISGLICYYDGDPAISSTNEVLRLPGFYHMKNPEKPFEIKILRFNFDVNITVEEMMLAYPEIILNFQSKFKLDNVDLKILKDISIERVLNKLNVDVRRNIIFENGIATSARINVKGNYINRFSGKSGSGSTIDAVMTYGNMDLKSAITWLKDFAGIKESKNKSVARQVFHQDNSSSEKLINEIEKDVKIFTWGTERLNNKLTPIQPIHFIILAGYTGMGKTAFAFDVAMKNAKEGKKVLYLSLEMTRDEILIRSARAAAGITKIEWRERKKISDFKKSLYSKKVKELGDEKNLILKGFPKGTSPTVEAIFEVIDLINPDLTFIDNLDLIAKENSATEYAEQTRIANVLMEKCHAENRPIIVIHHKNSKNKSTGLASNRGSGKISDNCNIALSCSRDWDENSNAKDNAKFTIKHEKDRDFGTFDIAEVYFKNGTFVDEFEDEPVAHWQDKDDIFNN